MYKIDNLPTTVAAKLLQSCPTLCNPIDGSPPGSPSLGFSRHYCEHREFYSVVCGDLKGKEI